MFQKIIFVAFAASLVFGVQELAIETETSSVPRASLENEVNESDLRVEECIQKDSSTAGMVECINAEFAIQDKILNENYKKAMRILNNENKKKLKDIQRKWMAYKEAKCSFMPEEGTIYLVVTASCYLEMTKELANMVTKFGGNW